MDTSGSNSGLDDPLALERVAVGPYCIFDSFRPDSQNLEGTDAESTGTDKPKLKMGDPMFAAEYPFVQGMANPWMVSSAEDAPFMDPSTDTFGGNSWNSFMQWPEVPHGTTPKDLNAQGLLGNLKAEQRASQYARRQEPQPQSQQERLAESVDGNNPLPPTTSTAFTFGTTAPVTDASDFNFVPATSVSPTSMPPAFSSSPEWLQDRQINTTGRPVFPTLSLDGAQQREQFVDAPPPPQSTPSLQHSPVSATHASTTPSSAHSSPEPHPPTNAKKRKSSASDDFSESKNGKQPPVKKTAHNMIEKRYRNNLNDKIAALRDSVPSLRVMSRQNGNGDEEDDDGEDLDGLTPAHKLNKATVLSKATEYIRHLEKRNKRLTDELTAIKMRMENYERIAMAGPMALTGAVTTPDGVRYQDDPFSATSRGTTTTQPAPQGMIPVPDNIMNLRANGSQAHYAPSQNGYPIFAGGAPRTGVVAQQPMVNGRRHAGMMGKLMVGSLAGLMILEGMSEREQSGDEPAGRGLFATPFNLLGQFARSIGTQPPTFGPTQGMLPLFKTFLIFGALIYLISPLFELKSKSKKKTTSAMHLSAAPSLASPVEVRRKAWLTAIQTVWVPQHTLPLELAALFLKALKLSSRKLIGWPAYALLTGIPEEQEAARVKAWEIALDAQLTGGDAEISWSRLMLTIMASGTLPNTPARYMLKALHVRILLWEVAKAGFGSWSMFNEISAKLARYYWNRARTEHNRSSNKTSKDGTDADSLPDHLAALVQLECDDVLVNNIIQRGYNLAWNRSSAENASPDENMDSVVEDFAISSPLDALAAWWSSHALSRALLSSLEAQDSKEEAAALEEVDLALQIAPPTSSTHTRALVAKAVLVREDRNSHIATAFKAIPKEQIDASVADSSHVALMNAISERPVAADVQTALTLAKCLYLAEQSQLNPGLPEARSQASHFINSHYLPRSNFSLLSFVAAFRVLRTYTADAKLHSEAKSGLERLASALRVLVGTEMVRKLGLGSRTRGEVIEKCLTASKTLVGLKEMDEESDAGYASSSDVGDHETLKG